MSIFKNKPSRLNRRFGFSLVEVGMSLTVMALAMGALFQLQSGATSSIQAQAAASRLVEVESAAQSYLQANLSNLLTATAGNVIVTIPVGRTSATGAVPAGPTGALPSLQGGGYLGPSFIDSNPYGQSHVFLVRQTVPGSLEGLVTEVGGRAIPDQYLGNISSKLGASGGAVLTSQASTTLRGTGGGWQATIASWNSIPQPGHAAALVNLSATALADYLYRDNIGVAAANQMNTAINMGGNGVHNNIDNAGIVTMDTLNALDGGYACASQIAGCQFWFGQDGYATDQNDGWVQFVGTSATGGFYVNGPSGGGNLQVSGNGTFGGSMTITGNDAVSGNSTIAGNSYVGGSSTIIGNENISGSLSTSGFSATSGYGTGMTAGLHTFDVYAEDQIGTGVGGTLTAYMNNIGQVYAGAGVTTGLQGQNGQSCSTNNLGIGVANGTIGSDQATGNLIWCQNGSWSTPLNAFTSSYQTYFNAYTGYSNPFSGPMQISSNCPEYQAAAAAKNQRVYLYDPYGNNTSLLYDGVGNGGSDAHFGINTFVSVIIPAGYSFVVTQSCEFSVTH